MGKLSREILWHFQCGDCRKWWSIGDAEPGRSEWFCPWCGKQQPFEISGELPEEKPDKPRATHPKPKRGG